MKPRQLHNSNSYFGCGAAALTVLLGGPKKTGHRNAQYWQKRILAYRKAHKPPRSSISYRAEELFSQNNRDYTYDNEMRAILGQELGVKLKFRHLTKKCRLSNLKFREGTWLVMLNNHFVVVQKSQNSPVAYCHDGSDNSKPQSSFRFKNDMVESVCKLPEYEDYREARTLTTKLRNETEEMLQNDKPYHPNGNTGYWKIVWIDQSY